MRKRHLAIAALVVVIAAGMLPLVASNAAAAYNNNPLSSQLWDVCSYPDGSGSQYVAKAGGISTMNYNAPAADAHPQFYASVIAHVAQTCSYWYIKRQKVTVSGTFPDGTSMTGDRFNGLTALFSPEQSGSYRKDPALTLVIGFIQNMDPTGISTALDLLDIAETNANGYTGVMNEAYDAYGQWSWNGFHDPFFADRGLQFGFQLVIDGQKSGTYTVYVTYETTFETPTLCDLGGCVNDLDRTLTISESFQYCYLACDPPKTNSAQVASITPPPPTMDPSASGNGHTASVSVNMKNTGTTTWYPVSRPSSDTPVSCADCYTERLALISPVNQGWSPTRVDLTPGVHISPGQTATFTFVLTAPQTQGTYSLQWQMVKEPGTGGSPSTSTFFGAATSAVQVSVTPPDWNPTTCGSITMYNDGYTQQACSLRIQSISGWSATVAIAVSPSGYTNGPTVLNYPASMPVSPWATAAGSVTIRAGTATGTWTFTVTETPSNGWPVKTRTFTVSLVTPPPPPPPPPGGRRCPPICPTAPTPVRVVGTLDAPLFVASIRP